MTEKEIAQGLRGIAGSLEDLSKILEKPSPERVEENLAVEVLAGLQATVWELMNVSKALSKEWLGRDFTMVGEAD